MPNRIPEGELVVPALEELAKSANGEVTTSDLITALANRFRPEGEDAEILDGRYDTKFSQKVRNLKSHKTLLNAGLAEHTEDGFRITQKGRDLISSLTN